MPGLEQVLVAPLVAGGQVESGGKSVQPVQQPWLTGEAGRPWTVTPVIIALLLPWSEPYTCRVTASMFVSAWKE